MCWGAAADREAGGCVVALALRRGRDHSHSDTSLRCELLWEPGSKPRRKGWREGRVRGGEGNEAVQQSEVCDRSCVLAPATGRPLPLLLLLLLLLLSSSLSSFHGSRPLIHLSSPLPPPAFSLHPTHFSPSSPSHHPHCYTPTPHWCALSLSLSLSLSPFHLLRRLYFTSLSP